MTRLDLTGPLKDIGCAIEEYVIPKPTGAELRDAALQRSAQGRQERIESVRQHLRMARWIDDSPIVTELTADDVFEWAEVLGYTEGDTRYLGNVLKGWDLVQPTERFVPSRRKSRHAAPVRIWRWV